MTEDKKVKILIPQEDNKEVVEVVEFMKILNSYEKKEFLAFLDGVRLARKLSAGTMGTV